MPQNDQADRCPECGHKDLPPPYTTTAHGFSGTAELFSERTKCPECGSELVRFPNRPDGGWQVERSGDA